MNTAIAQAYYASQDNNVKRMVTATGNGEWGESLAIACNYFGLKCKVYMVRSGYEQKATGRYAMEILGTEVEPSPSEKTQTGRKVIASKPDSTGSLSIALSEALKEASGRDDTKFSWGTVMITWCCTKQLSGSRQSFRCVGLVPSPISLSAQ